MNTENSGTVNFFNFFSFPVEPNEPTQNVTSLDSISLDNTFLGYPHDPSASTFSSPQNHNLSSQEHAIITQEFDSDSHPTKASSRLTFPGLGILVNRSPRLDYTTLFPPLESTSSSNEQASPLGLGFDLFETDIIDFDTLLGSTDTRLAFSPPAALPFHQDLPKNSDLSSSCSFMGATEAQLFFPGAVMTSPKLSEVNLDTATFFSSSPPAMPLLRADINMYEALSSKMQTDGGINPREILGDYIDPRQEEGPDVFGLPYLILRDNHIAERGAEEQTMQDNKAHVVDGAEGSNILRNLLNQDVERKSSPELPMPRYPPLSYSFAPPDSNIPAAVDEPLTPPSSPKAANISEVVEQTSPLKKATRRASTARAYNKPFMNSFVQSPVLNAHLGIHADDLMRRAEKFRERNPGEPLCQQWLLAYAGQLSEQGEQMGGWRCYVIGCSQTNKRRDHILTHVGSHVNERPYQCERCSMRFLRSNEHRRHLASHSGEKPWTCDLCKTQDRTFARRDLLRRHMRRAHGVVPGKENRPCKKEKHS